MSNQADFMDDFHYGAKLLSQLKQMNYHSHARACVIQKDKIKLYHYYRTAKNIHSIPLLIVFATVNRPEILDIFPEHSFIGDLLNMGMDVYLLDWGYPDQEDFKMTLNDYVTYYLAHCVNFIIKESKQKKINLLGICQGGVMSICYTLLFKTIKNLVLISTPIDFHTQDNVVSKHLKCINFEALIKLSGNISGPFLTQFFISLRPFELIGKKYLRFIDHMKDQIWAEKFLRVEKWLYDAPDQAGQAFSEFVKEFYQANKLIQGEVTLGGKKINLHGLTMPVLNIMAREDEIVPMSASKPLKYYAKQYTQKIFPSGHIGIYVSDRVGKRMARAITRWILAQT